MSFGFGLPVPRISSTPTLDIMNAEESQYDGMPTPLYNQQNIQRTFQLYINDITELYTSLEHERNSQKQRADSFEIELLQVNEEHHKHDNVVKHLKEEIARLKHQLSQATGADFQAYLEFKGKLIDIYNKEQKQPETQAQ